MARTASSFDRGRPRFKPQPRTLILCEDTKSCLDYLTDAARHFRSHAVVELTHCGKTNPKGIVSAAVNKLRAFDRVYCVIDRDTHHGWNEALSLAKEHGVTVIASHPCYEYWLLLHFDMTRRPWVAEGNSSAADVLIRRLRGEPTMVNYTKGGNRSLFPLLLERLPQARQRAVDVMDRALAEGELNPSTELHLVISALEKLGEPPTA